MSREECDGSEGIFGGASVLASRSQRRRGQHICRNRTNKIFKLRQERNKNMPLLTELFSFFADEKLQDVRPTALESC
jgi:hypothetical protein